ncbi:MAG: SPOR domain-containing protein [Bacteroidales bacterium]|nr:SPOR domain-containing protein [Bacteroidales bacterium]
MKNSKIILLVLLMIGFLNAQSQEGNIVVYKDIRLDILLEKYKEICEYEATIDGFRVQIFFDAGNQSQSNANQARTEFMRLYPEVDVYVVFDSPYYKVRAGDFRTRIEAYNFYLSIQSNYPNAFIVMDKISYPRIN